MKHALIAYEISFQLLIIKSLDIFLSIACNSMMASNKQKTIAQELSLDVESKTQWSPQKQKYHQIHVH